MKAEIITIGDEILIGQIVDTNSQWIAKELNKIGVSVYQISSIQDKEQHILNALKEAENRADIVLITGGLGPTKDDITKKTLAKYFNDDTFVEYIEVIAHIKKLFQKINHPYNAVQKYQAQIPSKAILLKNEYGTAPGMWFYENNTVFISLPGIPYEMKGLMRNEVLPRIQQQFQLPFIIHKIVVTYGVGESVIAERIADFENKLPSNIKLAYLPSFGKVRLRLSAKGKDKQELEILVNQKIKAISELIPEIIVGFEKDIIIEKRVGELLKSQQKTLATAESLTGGKLAASIVSVAGSSAYFKGSIVSYSVEIKKKILGVSANTIKQFSVVSKQVAEEMVIGVQKKLQTDYAIAVTGNAGPTTDHNNKSIGVVYISLLTPSKIITKEYNFGQPREKVIQRTVTKSLEILLKELLIEEKKYA